jgi:hypothetical protein
MSFDNPYLFSYPTASSTQALFMSSIPFDAAVVTADTEVESLPVENLQYPEPERVWRSESHTPRIVIQLSEDLAVNAAVIIAHNGESDATVRVQVGPTEDSVTDIATPTVDTGFVSMWPDSGKPEDIGLPHLSSLVLFDNDVPVRWVSIEFDDSSNVDDFEAGRVMVDRAVRLKIGGQVGLQVSTMGDQRPGEFNRIFGDERGPNSRKMVVPLPSVDKEYFRRYIFAYQLKHGKTKDFFFSANPEADIDFCLYSMQCVFGDMTAFSRNLLFNSNGATWSGAIPLLEQT